MPMLTTPGYREASSVSPVSTSAYRPLRFHRRWPSTVRIPLANRCTTSMVMVPSWTIAGDDPAARGADVDRRDDGGARFGHRGPRPVIMDTVVCQRRKAAATPASTGMCRPVVWDRSAEHSTNTALATCSGSTSRFSRVRCA